CTKLFPGASMMECEQYEMFGIKFKGHPLLQRLLFADTTPETPLRRGKE
ncbi:MAG: NADH-quinone oxidoreductase subunit C, partial [Candidatus Aenigmatarchaeota archaeon]